MQKTDFTLSQRCRIIKSGDKKVKELLKLYAEYNHQTNTVLFEVLPQIPMGKLKRKRKNYHGSLYLLFRHLVIGSWHYLNAIHFISDNKYCADLPRLVESNESPSIGELCSIMLDLDNILIATVRDISEKDLFIEKKKIRIYNGRIVNMTIWQYFLQHITHQTSPGCARRA